MLTKYNERKGKKEAGDGLFFKEKVERRYQEEKTDQVIETEIIMFEENEGEDHEYRDRDHLLYDL
jgi:hypothetical protein